MPKVGGSLVVSKSVAEGRVPDWRGAMAYHALRAFLAERGEALPPGQDEPSRADSLAFIQSTLRRDVGGLDHSGFSRQYIKWIWHEVALGRRSVLSLLAAALHFPRTSAALTQVNLRRRLRHWKRLRRMKRQGIAAELETRVPSLTHPELGRICVRCFDGWGDLAESLHFLTPGGRGVWDDVVFTTSDDVRPDWVGVFNVPDKKVPVELAASPNRVFFAIGEPPDGPFRRVHVGQGEASLVLTTDQSLVDQPNPPRDYMLAPVVLRSWSVRRTYDQLRTSTVADKPKALSWVTSNMARLEGHKKRLRFLERLRGEVPFDLFGRGFQPIADKWDALAPYRYSIAFENTVVPYYFTEKIMDCFVAETMPIYFGAPNITDFFPAEAMVIIDPDDPHVFDQIRAVIASDLWRERRPAIQEAKRLVLEDYNTFAYLAKLVKTLDRPPLPVRHLVLNPAGDEF